MGCVYILTNEAMPDLVKIGFTTRTAKKRAEELYKDRSNAITGVPMPFSVAHEELCEDPQKLETLIHQELEDHRLRNPCNGKIEREFFKYPADEAFQKLKDIHQRHPEHAACLNFQETEEFQLPVDGASQIPQTLDDRVWRKWTSHFLTDLKRKAKTKRNTLYE